MINYTSGYQLVFVSQGRGRATVQRESQVVFRGTFEECQEWLKNRACRPVWN